MCFEYIIQIGDKGYFVIADGLDYSPDPIVIFLPDPYRFSGGEYAPLWVDESEQVYILFGGLFGMFFFRSYYGFAGIAISAGTMDKQGGYHGDNRQNGT